MSAAARQNPPACRANVVETAAWRLRSGSRTHRRDIQRLLASLHARRQFFRRTPGFLGLCGGDGLFGHPSIHIPPAPANSSTSTPSITTTNAATAAGWQQTAPQEAAPRRRARDSDRPPPTARYSHHSRCRPPATVTLGDTPSRTATTTTAPSRPVRQPSAFQPIAAHPNHSHSSGLL